MEPILFFITIIIFWTPALYLLIIGLMTFKSKLLRKTLLILSLVTFSIPFLIILVDRIDEKIKISNLKGTYFAKDDQSNTITVEIKSNNQFLIQVENCYEANRSGSWQYAKEYEAFLYDLDSNNISFQKNNEGKLILNSDIKTDCCNLSELILSEK